MSIDYSLFAFPKGDGQVKKNKKAGISTINRKQIKNEFKGRCALCNKTANHLHHIFYKSEDRSKVDDINNLIPLCVECHLKVHKNKKYWQQRLIKIRKNIDINFASKLNSKT